MGFGIYASVRSPEHSIAKRFTAGGSSIVPGEWGLVVAFFWPNFRWPICHKCLNQTILAIVLIPLPDSAEKP